MTEFPNAFDPVYSYAMQIMGGKIAHLRPPSGAINVGVAGLEGSSLFGLVLDRQGQYQLELFIVPPNIKHINEHTHPDVDSFEMHVAGDFEFINNGLSYPTITDGQPLYTRQLTKVDSTMPHAGNFTHGGAFFSFQYWKNGVSPSSVGYNFIDNEASK
jgi:hypothetical protein